MAKYAPDLIGLQESVKTYLPHIVDTINSQLQGQYKSIGWHSVQFIYNSDTLGEGHLLSPPDLHIRDAGRGMIVVWFPKRQLLAINLHAPHKVHLAQEISKTFDTVAIPELVKPQRIIVTGDFNDAYYQTLTELNIMGKILRQYGSGSVAKSCCTDTNYQLIGDYIFDSDYNLPGFYGIQKDDLNQLMSDHYPIIYYQ